MLSIDPVVVWVSPPCGPRGAWTTPHEFTFQGGRPTQKVAVKDVIRVNNKVWLRNACQYSP